MANAIVEMGVNFTLGDGVSVDAKHKKVQALLDAFWRDPDNHLNTRQFDIATELSLYGELFIRLFVNQYNGHIKIAHIDPALIDQIDSDPDNVEHQIRCHRRAASVTASQGYPPGAPPAGSPSPSTTRDPSLEGDWFSIPDQVLHFAINKVTNQKRGKSDLATLLPWLRRYKDWLIDRVRINKYKSAFIWDVTLTGADKRTIADKMAELAQPPEPGSLRIHNESEAWAAVQPQIAGDDVASDGQAIKIMVAMGAGLPEHYLSEGGDVNRATAAEMGLPVLKKYQRRQDYLNSLFRTLLDRVIAEAQRAGTLPRTIDTAYDIRFPPLEATAAEAQGTAALRMAQALQIARPLGIISTHTAAQLFFDACREEVDVAKELSQIDPLPPTAAQTTSTPLSPSQSGQDRDHLSSPDAPALLNPHYHGKAG